MALTQISAPLQADPGSVAAAPHNVVEQNHQVPDQLYADVAGGPPPIPPRTDYVPSLKKAEVNPNSAHPLTPAPVGGHQDQAVSLSKDIHHGNAPPASLGEVPSQHGVPPGTTHQTPVISAETEASHDAALIEKGGKKTDEVVASDWRWCGRHFARGWRRIWRRPDLRTYRSCAGSSRGWFNRGG
ncbi:hypothetical protein FRB93_013205 [Tulasnella sp. JGI-2019a]|nr:hypothetical protein FRB93_013205 [Tulasnella sp. JGI-2019a]